MLIGAHLCRKLGVRYVVYTKRLVCWPWGKNLIIFSFSSKNSQEKVDSRWAMINRLGVPYTRRIELQICDTDELRSTHFLILYTLEKFAEKGRWLVKLRNHERRCCAVFTKLLCCLNFLDSCKLFINKGPKSINLSPPWFPSNPPTYQYRNISSYPDNIPIFLRDRSTEYYNSSASFWWSIAYMNKYHATSLWLWDQCSVIRSFRRQMEDDIWIGTIFSSGGVQS